MDTTNITPATVLRRARYALAAADQCRDTRAIVAYCEAWAARLHAAADTCEATRVDQVLDLRDEFRDKAARARLLSR